MATKKSKVTFLNGYVKTLTTGEINAIERYARQNGTDPEATQYDPGNVSYRTVQNLVAKGILVRKGNGVHHFAPGLLPVLRMSLYADRPFSLTGVLAKALAEQEAGEMKTLAAEDFQVGYRYWPVRPGFEDAWTIAEVTRHEAEYQVMQDGEFVTPMLVTHVRRDGTTRTFEVGEKVAIKGPWKTED